MHKKDKIKVFFVDDNEIDALAFKALVNKINSPRKYELTIFNGYQQAMDNLHKHHYDIYFVDFRLDKGTGLDFIHKAIEKGNDGPYIIITNYDQIEFYDQGAERGVYEYLIKSELTPSMIDRASVYALARKSLEYKLSYEKKCFQQVLGSLPYAVMHVDKTFHIKEVNNHIPRILGWKKKDLLGKNVFDHIIAEDKDALIDAFFHMDSPTLSFRSIWQTKLGHSRTIYWDCIYRNFSESNGFLFIAKDMTMDLILADEHIDEEEAGNMRNSLDDAANNFGV